MKKHNQSKANLLVDYAITKAMVTSLLITLTILWDQADWTTEGLEEFIDRYWDWIEAYNTNKDAVRDLVEAMKKDTGIDVRI